VLGIFSACAALAPTRSVACAACFGGNIDSPMADGMNWGIFTLLAVIGTVLLTLLTFFIHLIRKSEALAAAAETSAHSPQL
jgi:fructose-specific phosphotransferase system IIC component